MEKQEVLDFIKNNPQLKTSELLGMRELRSNSISICDILVFINELRK